MSRHEGGPVVPRLSTLDRFLPIWIGLAMAGGLLLGRWVPGIDDALSAIEVDGNSLPIAIGLLDRSKRGVWVYYRVRTEALEALAALIGGAARA
jgi:hypothetical protein